MTRMVKWLAPAVIWGGAPILAYVCLAPALWPRDDIDGFLLMSAFGLGNGLIALGAGSRFLPWRTELRMLLAGGAFLAAASLALDVVLGPAVVRSTAQQVVFAVAVVVVVTGLVSLVRDTRRGAPLRADPERDARREAIRENVRREIAEIERTASHADPPDS